MDTEKQPRRKLILNNRNNNRNDKNNDQEEAQERIVFNSNSSMNTPRVFANNNIDNVHSNNSNKEVNREVNKGAGTKVPPLTLHLQEEKRVSNLEKVGTNLEDLRNFCDSYRIKRKSVQFKEAEAVKSKQKKKILKRNHKFQTSVLRKLPVDKNEKHIKINVFAEMVNVSRKPSRLSTQSAEEMKHQTFSPMLTNSSRDQDQYENVAEDVTDLIDPEDKDFQEFIQMKEESVITTNSLVFTGVLKYLIIAGMLLSFFILVNFSYYLIRYSFYDIFYFWLGIGFSILMLSKCIIAYRVFLRADHYYKLFELDFLFLLTLMMNLVMIISHNFLSEHFLHIWILTKHWFTLNAIFFVTLVLNASSYYINGKLSAYYFYENYLLRKVNSV